MLNSTNECNVTHKHFLRNRPFLHPSPSPHTSSLSWVSYRPSSSYPFPLPPSTLLLLPPPSPRILVPIPDVTHLTCTTLETSYQHASLPLSPPFSSASPPSNALRSKRPKPSILTTDLESPSTNDHEEPDDSQAARNSSTHLAKCQTKHPPLQHVRGS